MALLQLRQCSGDTAPQLLLSSDSVTGPDPVLCNHAAVLNKDPHHYPYQRAQASIFMKTLGREKILMASSTCTSF